MISDHHQNHVCQQPVDFSIEKSTNVRNPRHPPWVDHPGRENLSCHWEVMTNKLWDTSAIQKNMLPMNSIEVRRSPNGDGGSNTQVKDRRFLQACVAQIAVFINPPPKKKKKKNNNNNNKR